MLSDSKIGWQPIEPERRHVTGSLLFGVGWGVTGVCPGPIAAQIGQGVGLGVFTLIGTVIGVRLFLRTAADDTEPATEPSEREPRNVLQRFRPRRTVLHRFRKAGPIQHGSLSAVPIRHDCAVGLRPDRAEDWRKSYNPGRNSYVSRGDHRMALTIGSDAPDFEAETTEGPISFHEWLGDSWAVLFSHPRNFTPVCTTELGYMASIKPEFDKRGVKIIGLSVDPVDNHEKWAEDIAETQGTAPNYPMIARQRLQGRQGLRDAAGRGRGRARRSARPPTTRPSATSS